MSIFDRWFNTEEEPEVETPTPVIIRNTLPKAPRKPKEPDNKVRSFAAGQSNNFNFNWIAPTTSINGELKSSMTMMRARCRERAKNDDYAKGYINMCVSNIVGPKGIRLQSLASDPNGERDTLAINAIELAWSQWAKYPQNVDVSGRDNWKALQEQLTRIFATDGEIFIRHIEGADAGSFGYSIQVIDPALCDENLSLKLESGNVVEMGVELNKYNKPIAYWFLQPTQKDGSPQSSSSKHLRVPANEIIHAFKTEFAGQIRGIPPMAVALPRMKMLSDWEDAALLNAQIGARKMGFYTSTGADDLTTGANAMDPDGELIDELQAGTFTKLPSGVGIEKFESEYPNNEMSPFKKSMLRAIAVGLKVDYFTLNSDLESVNLSSARVAIAETREQWKAEQGFMIGKVITPIYERWLAQALVRKKITVKGKPLNIMNIEKYKNVQWLGRRWQFSDPVKDTTSNIDLINNGIKSRTAVCNDLGLEFDQQVALLAQEAETMSDAGLTPVEQEQTLIDPNEDQE